MKFTTFFTHIMFLNNMGAQGIRHVINIMGYVRDTFLTEPTLQAANYALSHQRDCPLVFIFYRSRGCINEAFLNKKNLFSKIQI